MLQFPLLDCEGKNPIFIKVAENNAWHNRTE